MVALGGVPLDSHDIILDTLEAKIPITNNKHQQLPICAMVKVVAIFWDGKNPTFNKGNPYNGYKPYWVDDHPLLYGIIGSLDPSTYRE